MLYLQHWSLKAGLHKKMSQEFLDDKGAYPGVDLIGRYHSPASLEGWIILKTEDPKALFIYTAKWANVFNWETFPVFEDEEALPMNKSIYENKDW